MKWNTIHIDYLIVGSGLIMVYMNDSSIFSDDFHNLHLLHKPSKGETKIHQQKNVNTMSNTVFKVGFLDFNFFSTTERSEECSRLQIWTVWCECWYSDYIERWETNLRCDQVWRWLVGGYTRLHYNIITTLITTPQTVLGAK